jgi:hypothetical protein
LPGIIICIIDEENMGKNLVMPVFLTMAVVFLAVVVISGRGRQGGGTGTETETGVSTEGSGIRGTVLLGPTCPVVRVPPDDKCADKPYATTLTVTGAGDTKVIKEFTSGSDGKFEVRVTAGDYIIRPATTAKVMPRCGPSGVLHVEEGSWTETTISCDTGIR